MLALAWIRSTSRRVRWIAVLVAVAVAATVMVLALKDEATPIRGLAFAPFRDCQHPERGVLPSAEQMREDVDLIRGMGNAVRTYSSSHNAEAVGHARSVGLRVSAGAWLGPENTDEERAANRREIESVIALSKRFTLESVIIGNEVLLRHDLPAQRLAEHIRYVRSQVGVPVTTAEPAGVAMQPEHRVVIDAVDYLTAHIHPYWDGVDIDGAAWYVADVYHKVRSATGKKVVIGETGWPSGGPANGHAMPNVVNAGRFLAEWAAVARLENIDYYYFSAFDEKWKSEGGVGPHWGTYDAARRPKYPTTSLLTESSPAPQRPTVPSPSPSPSPSEPGGPGEPAGSGGRPDTDQQVAAGPGTRDSLVLYRTWPVPTDYVPSGFFGDHDDVTFTDCARGGRDGETDPAAIDYAIRVDYRPSAAENGWAGMYWQNPANNWGDKQGGLDLRGFTALTFYARGEQGGEKVRFFSGGIGEPGARFPDSLAKQEIAVTLRSTWQQYVIDLRGGDLSRVVGGFGWSASQVENSGGATLYLDDIQFDKTTQHRPCSDPPPGTPPGTVYVLAGNTLCANPGPAGKYVLGVDSADQLRTWLRSEGDALRMDYPGQQRWGAVFLTAGDPVPPGARSGQDLSRCQTLQVDLRSDTPGARVGIGMKDKHMADDGKETKIRVSPTTTWKTTSINLADFKVDLSAIYVVIEFVFGAADPKQTVYARNVRFLCD
jgi:exo-beta-1,3-glucanase (GH17 family)